MARHRCLENPPDAQGIDSDICAQTDPMILIRLKSWKPKPKFERMLICSSFLSDNFLLRVGLDPRRWCAGEVTRELVRIEMECHAFVWSRRGCRAGRACCP